jgi:hypothetical protein
MVIFNSYVSLPEGTYCENNDYRCSQRNAMNPSQTIPRSSAWMRARSFLKRSRQGSLLAQLWRYEALVDGGIEPYEAWGMTMNTWDSGLIRCENSWWRMESHLEFGGDLTNINELQRECRYIYTYIYTYTHTYIYIILYIWNMNGGWNWWCWRQWILTNWMGMCSWDLAISHELGGGI